MDVPIKVYDKDNWFLYKRSDVDEENVLVFDKIVRNRITYVKKKKSVIVKALTLRRFFWYHRV